MLLRSPLAALTCALDAENAGKMINVLASTVLLDLTALSVSKVGTEISTLQCAGLRICSARTSVRSCDGTQVALYAAMLHFAGLCAQGVAWVGGSGVNSHEYVECSNKVR